MKTVATILSIFLVFGLFTADSFAYTRPQEIVSEYNDFETSLGDWTNGLISGCAGGGDVTSSNTTVAISSDADGTRGKYLVVNNEGSLSATATFLFDIDSAKKTAPSAQTNAKVKPGDYFAFEFDFKLPSNASSTTALELMVWDTRGSRNRYTLVKIIPSSGKITAGLKSYTIDKNKWYKMKLECVVDSALQRFTVMDDYGNELFVSNINDSSKYLPKLLYGIITFSQGGSNCEFYLDNTKAYTFNENDLNADRVIFSDNTGRILNYTDSSFEIEGYNDFTSFTNTVEHPSSFIVNTKIKLNDTTNTNDIKLSLIEDGTSDAVRHLTTISPHNGKVTLGSIDSSASYGGLCLEADKWYDVEFIYNTNTDYQRLEITDTNTLETQVFSGNLGYNSTDISAFDGVLFETVCSQDVETSFEGIRIYVASQSHAAPFFTMDSYEIDASVSEITVKASAPLTGVSSDTVTLKNGDGDIIVSDVSYNGTDTVTIIPSKPLRENDRMQLTFSKDILVGGENPKFDSVINIIVLIDEISMDYAMVADGETILSAADLINKSNVSCTVTTTLRDGKTNFDGTYIMTIMDKNNEIKGICAQDISLTEALTTGEVNLSLSVPDNGDNLKIYIMLIDDFQNSKALAKYIKIY